VKKYKVWLHIEEFDDDDGVYEDLEEHTISIDPEFNTVQEAIGLKEDILKHFNSNLKINSLRQIIDRCPICKSDTMVGPNGCIICSKNGCNYWRE